MAVKYGPKRSYDIREGTRDYQLCIRLNKNELAYVEKMAKKLQISRTALIVDHLNAHRKRLGKKESNDN